MPGIMREADWKVFRRVREAALERFCDGVLDELCRVAHQPEGSSHERYLAVYRLVRERDKELANAFDDPRRSIALSQLAILHRHGLISDEEFAEFSEETRQWVESALKIG